MRPAAELGFALYGGTAIALRLGHRASVDFDFFSEKPLDRDALHGVFPFIAKSAVLQDQQNTWILQVPYGNSEREYVKVILQRAEAKDYRDIVAMVCAGVNLASNLDQS